jgi:hypothetical protein
MNPTPAPLSPSCSPLPSLALWRCGGPSLRGSYDSRRTYQHIEHPLLHRRAPVQAALTDAYADGRKDEREQWEPVARLALAALNSCDGCDSYKGYSQWFGQEQVENAIKALCALICPVCLGAGWVAERPGEQCACGLHSWEARK